MALGWAWSLLALGLICHFAAAAPQFSSRKERFLLSVLKFHNSRCSVGGTGGLQRTEGVCQHRAQCRYHKGKSLGSCAVFGACCAVERTCNNATSLQVSYFVQPDNLEAMCSFRVDVNNRDICQIRLDFEEFNIAQPTNAPDLVVDPLGNTNTSFECLNDSFIVTSTSTGSNKLPVLCGENAGQHMYVPVNRSQSANFITLSFLLADRTVVTGLPSPKWKIKVSQIECTGMTNDYSSISSSIHTYNHQHWNLHLPVNDHLRIAPQGCLQYFIERSGTYETFNYNGGKGPYIGNLNYAICFRKFPDVCGIRHTPVSFNLAYNIGRPNDPYTDESCYETNHLQNQTFPSQDYLYVPEGFTTQNIVGSKYCGTAINSTNFVTSVAPGPLEVFFRSDKFSWDNPPEKGFQINYQMLNSGCH